MTSCEVINLSSDDETVPSSKASSSSDKKSSNGVTRVSALNCETKSISGHKRELDHDKTGRDLLQKFVDTCLKYDNTASMRKIIDKKVWKNFELSNPAYRLSGGFKQIVAEKTEEIISNPKNLYVPLKELVDELKSRILKTSEPPKKRIKLLPSTEECSSGQIKEEVAESSDTLEEEPKTNSEPKVSDRLMRKLCKTLELLHRKIKKLEQKEVDWDEDDDSTYIQLQRYKERFLQVHRKLQEYEGEIGDTWRNVRRITFNGTKFPTINRAVEKYVNKKGEFPDFYDVLKLLKSSYAAENIKIRPELLHEEAKAVFKDIGDQLQKKRQLDYWDSHCMYLGSERDPAEENEELRSKLQENRTKYGGRIDEVINQFVEKSVTLSLQKESGKENQSNKSGQSSTKQDKDNGDEDDDKDNCDDNDNGEDGDGQDDEEEEEEEEEEDEKDDFLEKIIQNEEDDDDLKELKSNVSIDEDDTESDFIIHFGGPVSPPQAEMDFSEESSDIDEGEADVLGLNESHCASESSSSLHRKDFVKDNGESEQFLNKVFKSDISTTNYQKSLHNDSDCPQPELLQRTPEILKSLGMRPSTSSCMKTDLSSPKRGVFCPEVEVSSPGKQAGLSPTRQFMSPRRGVTLSPRKEAVPFHRTVVAPTKKEAVVDDDIITLD